MNHIAFSRLGLVLGIIGGMAGCATDPYAGMARQEQPVCAWVLWSEETWVTGPRRVNWKIFRAFHEMDECEETVLRLVSIDQKSENAKTEAIGGRIVYFDYGDGEVMRILYLCLPSNVDPRNPSARR